MAQKCPRRRTEGRPSLVPSLFDERSATGEKPEKGEATAAEAEKKKSRKKEEAPPPLTLYAVHTVLSLFFFGAPLSLSSCVFVLPAGRACVKSPFAAAAAAEEAAKTRGMEGKRGGLG